MFITIIFINTLMHQKFILASSSKSRYKILKNAGLNFTQKKPNYNEEEIKKTINRKIKPEIFAKKLSYEKARSVSIKKLYANKIVLGCDPKWQPNTSRFCPSLLRFPGGLPQFSSRRSE